MQKPEVRDQISDVRLLDSDFRFVPPLQGGRDFWDRKPRVVASLQPWADVFCPFRTSEIDTSFASVNSKSVFIGVHPWSNFRLECVKVDQISLDRGLRLPASGFRFVPPLQGGRDFWDRKPRVAAASRPDPGLSSFVLSGLGIWTRDSGCQPIPSGSTGGPPKGRRKKEECRSRSSEVGRIKAVQAHSVPKTFFRVWIVL